MAFEWKEESTIDKKTCAKCGEEKHISEFGKKERSTDGFFPQCKSCVAAYNKYYQTKHRERLNTNLREYGKSKNGQKAKRDYRKKHHAKLLKNQRIYYQENKEIILNKGRDYYKKNKARCNDRQAAYNKTEHAKILRKNKYINNKKEISDNQRNYYLKNKEKIKKKVKEYRKTEIGKSVKSRSNHKRRALKIGAGFEDFNPTDVFERDHWICQSCGIKTRPDYKNSHHPKYPNLDHIIPLSKGGEHSMKNTQCLCNKCNNTKGAGQKRDQLLLFGT